MSGNVREGLWILDVAILPTMIVQQPQNLMGQQQEPTALYLRPQTNRGANVEKLVARELKRAGRREVSTESFRQIVDQQLAKLVDEHFKAMERGQQTQQQRTRETGYQKSSAYEQNPGPEDPPDKPQKPGHPDPRGSYGHEPKPDYGRHRSKK
jgi:hypothetical protein